MEAHKMKEMLSGTNLSEREQIRLLEKMEIIKCEEFVVNDIFHDGVWIGDDWNNDVSDICNEIAYEVDDGEFKDKLRQQGF